MAFSINLDEFRRQWKDEINQHGENLENAKSTSEVMGMKNNQPKRLITEDDGESLAPQSKLWKGVCGNDEQDSIIFGAKTKECNTINPSSAQVKSLGFVDIFIKDLIEIDPVPFFDIELPREVAVKIFRHLSARDLCRCAQVSKSWQSLAEDELLWCRICHQLGYEEQAEAVEKENWKDIVKEAVEMEQSLVYNWKNRVGGLDEMSFIPGGILTAASSYQDWLVAGYTSLDIKLWDLSKDTSCLLTPSSKALVLSSNGSFVQNYVKKITVNSEHTFALYNTGLLNIWENNGRHLQPVHQSQHSQGKMIIRSCETSPLFGIDNGKSIQLFAEKTKDDYMARAYHMKSKDRTTSEGAELSGHQSGEEDFSQQRKWKQTAYINYSQLLREADRIHINDFLITRKRPPHSSNAVSEHLLITAVNDEVIVHDLSLDLADPKSMTKLYHTVFAPVHMMDYRNNGELAVVVSKGHTDSYFTSRQSNEIQVYNVDYQKEILAIGPTPESVKILNMKDSPEKEFVTGGHGIVHIYDKRIGQSVQSLKDQILFPITQVQLDEWKVVTGNEAGYVCTWDRRMATKCWEMHNRHPVAYICFRKNIMIAANIPSDLSPCFQDPANPEYMLHKRYRGQLSVFDFSVSQQRDELPSICQSTFDEPERYNYNIRLAMPYDRL